MVALARRARPRSPISVPSGVGVLVMRGSAQRTHLAVLVATLALACRAGSRPAPGGGLRVVDDAGRTVALAGPARRIVSLSPAITELVFALGAGERLVGRTTWCDYPPAARAVPSVGDGLNPSVEAVAARRPDLVVLYRSTLDAAAARAFERLGIPAIVLRQDRLADLARAGDSLAAALAAVGARPGPPLGVRLAFVTWDNPPVVIGGGSYLDELAALAGATNVFHDLPAASAAVGLETLAARDPDVIAVLGDSGAAELPPFARRPEWQAGRARRGGTPPPAGGGAPMKWLGLAAAAMAALALAVALGPTHVPLGALPTSDIVRTLRLPRAVLAFGVGGSLALAGAGLQALVRNPLADPYLLGLSGGAGLGAVLGIALHLASPWALPLAAFGGGLAAMALVYRLALLGGGALDPRVLILAGVAVGAFAAAVTTAVVSLSEPAELRNALLWLWGGLSGASWDTVLVFCAYAPLPAAVLLAAARPLDLLALGEEPARHLGVEVEPWKRRVYFAASLLTAAAVAVSGVIGFVGLVVPHAMRALWGHRHRPLLPAAFLAGGTLLVLADTVARVAVAPRELPVGIVTALVGVPVFALLLRRWTAG